MNRITIYPYIAYEKGERANPYIHDFVEVIENSGWAVVGNRPMLFASRVTIAVQPCEYLINYYFIHHLVFSY